MPVLEPEVMIRQVERLATDLRESATKFDHDVREALAKSEWQAIRNVTLIGSGDSYCASLAVQMAFVTLAGVSCESMSTLQFLSYGAGMRNTLPGQTLVIATSASGRTERVVQAIERARRDGVRVLAFTGIPDSPVTRVADHAVVLELPDTEPSPGIRSYQASMLGLLLLAIRLNESHPNHSLEQAGRLRHELVSLADAIHATTTELEERCRELAGSIAGVAAAMVLGSGPSYGTARFCAAKLVEATSILGVAQDLEEWWHVERFARPTDMPVLMIAPPGRCHSRIAELAAAARGLGRRVIAITDSADSAVNRHASVVLPVQGEVREEFSPLLYHLFVSYLACFTSERLGRRLFQLDPIP